MSTTKKITITTPYILIALLRNNKLSPITYARFKYTFTILTHLLNINLTNLNADVARSGGGAEGSGGSVSSRLEPDLVKLKFSQHTPPS